MSSQFWWHMARASGIVTWGFLMASALWGILLSTRVLKPYDRPAWLLDLHSWLGAITIFGTGLHLRSEEHTSELQALAYLVCRLLLEKKN